jgi:hypothetical protein
MSLRQVKIRERVIESEPDEDTLVINSLCHFFGIEPVSYTGETLYPRQGIDAVAKVINSLPTEARNEFATAVVREYILATGCTAPGFTMESLEAPEWPQLQELKGFARARYEQLVSDPDSVLRALRKELAFIDASIAALECVAPAGNKRRDRTPQGLPQAFPDRPVRIGGAAGNLRAMPRL